MFLKVGPGTVAWRTISKQSLTCFEEDSVVVYYTPSTSLKRDAVDLRGSAMPPTPRARIFSNIFGSFSQSFEFSSTPSVCKIFSQRPGGRDPSAVKVSARYDAWRLQKLRKTETEKRCKL